MSVAIELDAPPTGTVPARKLAPVPDRIPVRTPAPRPEGLARVHVLHPPVDAPLAAPLRLTGRGVVVLALAVSLLAVGLLAWARASAPGPAAPPAPAGVVTVAPGDTLWSIAGRVAPNRDPRAEVAALQHGNHLRGVDLVPGQRLRVP